MKIALIGTAPSSMTLAPYADPSYKIWACSPGTYPYLPRCDAFFELHRWEPGVVGKPATQKPWFSPEYVQWMAMQSCPIWMADHVPQIPNSRALPVEDLLQKYGTYFFTSSIAWMLACAIEDILEDRTLNKARTGEPDVIGLWGVDMAATEEWGYQRAGCQHFLLLAADLDIQINVPPESDLLRPMPLYAIDESSHWMIKLTARKHELTGRLNTARAALVNAQNDVAFLSGALDDLDYCTKTWGNEREGMGTSFDIMAKSPELRSRILASTTDKPSGDGEAGAQVLDLHPAANNG